MFTDYLTLCSKFDLTPEDIYGLQPDEVDFEEVDDPSTWQEIKATPVAMAMAEIIDPEELTAEEYEEYGRLLFDRNYSPYVSREVQLETSPWYPEELPQAVAA